MAKMIINVFCCALLHCTAAAITNLAQIVGLSIDSTRVSEIPRRDFSTPETSYLNFVRALATTNEADWVAGFAPQKIVEYAGTENPDVLSGRSDSPLTEFFSAHVVSNMILTTYSIADVSEYTKRISADIVLIFDDKEQTNSYPIVFSKTNNTWVIVDFLDDE